MNNLDVLREFQNSSEGSFFSSKAYLEVRMEEGVECIRVKYLNFFARIIRKLGLAYESIRIRKVADFIRDHHGELFTLPEIKTDKLKGKLMTHFPREFDEKCFSPAYNLYSKRVFAIEDLFDRLVSEESAIVVQQRECVAEEMIRIEEMRRKLDEALWEKGELSKEIKESFYREEEDVYSDTEASGLLERLEILKMKELQELVEEKSVNISQMELQRQEKLEYLSASLEHLEEEFQSLSSQVEKSFLSQEKQEDPFPKQFEDFHKRISNLEDQFKEFSHDLLSKKNLLGRAERFKENLQLLESNFQVDREGFSSHREKIKGLFVSLEDVKLQIQTLSSEIGSKTKREEKFVERYQEIETSVSVIEKEMSGISEKFLVRANFTQTFSAFKENYHSHKEKYMNLKEDNCVIF